MMKGKDSNENKGFAFVTYRNVDLASKAIDKLNNTEFKVCNYHPSYVPYFCCIFSI